MATTERMTLRRTNWPDVDDVVALNVEVMRHLGASHPMGAARVLSEEMPRLMKHDKRFEDLGGWVARNRADGQFLGWFLIAAVDGAEATAELSYRLRLSAWDQGYEVEGALFLVELARAAGMTTVVATASDAHPGSGELMEQAGFLPVDPTQTPAADGSPRDVAYTMNLTGADLRTR